MNKCTRDTVTEYPCSSGHFHFTTIAKSGKVTLAAPLNDSYVEIMEVHCQLLGCYLDRRQLVVTCRSQHQHERQLPLPLPTYKTLFVQFLSAKLRSSMGALMTTHRRCRTTNRTRSESRNWGHLGLSSAVAAQCCFMEPTALTFLTRIVKYTPRRFNQATCRACNKF